MKPEYVGLLSLVVLFGAIFIGFPIAFTLIAVALGIGYLALGDLALHLMTLQFFSVMRDPTLASVPFFLFMGYLLEQSGLMERLFRGVQLMLVLGPDELQQNSVQVRVLQRQQDVVLPIDDQLGRALEKLLQP